MDLTISLVAVAAPSGSSPAATSRHHRRRRQVMADSSSPTSSSPAQSGLPAPKLLAQSLTARAEAGMAIWVGLQAEAWPGSLYQLVVDVVKDASPPSSTTTAASAGGILTDKVGVLYMSKEKEVGAIFMH